MADVLESTTHIGEAEDKPVSRADGESKTGKLDMKPSLTLSVDSDESLSSIKKGEDEPIPEESVMEMRVGDWKHMRRIIAEDPEWSLATVPLLKELVVKHIADNFENESFLLKSVEEKSQNRILGKISTDLPLKVTALLVDDESYWERCCRTRWETCDVSAFGNSWKRMYMERNMQEIIELFVPNTSEPELLEETLKYTASFIKKLNIGQLLPPVKLAYQGPDCDETSDAGETEDESPCDHFHFGPILPKFPFLEELHICYGVRDCGMNFEWNLFQFTAKDCMLLSEAVAACKTLRVFRLHRSKVDDDKVRILVSHILDHPTLQELDLSHNIIGDRGARAIGKLLNKHSQLTKLNLCDNQIRVGGGQAIGHALIQNTLLVYLNLRLNRLGDEGGQAICRGLLKNRSIVEVNLGSNDLAEPSASILCQVLMKNPVIRSIDLSCNRLGPDGGKQIQEGMEENKTVIHLDLRLTESGQESEYCISEIIHRNQEADRLERIKNNEPINAQFRKTSFEPQSTHRYRLAPSAIIA